MTRTEQIDDLLDKATKANKLGNIQPVAYALIAAMTLMNDPSDEYIVYPPGSVTDQPELKLEPQPYMKEL